VLLDVLSIKQARALCGPDESGESLPRRPHASTKVGDSEDTEPSLSFWWEQRTQLLRTTGGYQMSFQAKVKETDQLFVATNKVDKDGVWSKDAHKLEKGKSYVGYLFSASPMHFSGHVGLSKPTFAVFESDALEELSVRLKLVL